MLLRYAIPQTMAIFETPDQLYCYISELFEEIATLPEAQETIKSLTLCVRFNLYDARLCNDVNCSEW